MAKAKVIKKKVSVKAGVKKLKKILNDKEINFDRFGDIVGEAHVCKVCEAKEIKTVDELIEHLKETHGLEGNVLSEYKMTYNVQVYFEKEEEEEKKPKVKRFGETLTRGILADVEILKRDETCVDTKQVPKLDDSFLFVKDEHKQLIKVLQEKGFSTTLVTGEKALGKTQGILRIAAEMNQPVIRFNMTGKTIPNHILVDQDFDGDKIKWVDRSLVTAARTGAWWVCDEISACSPTVAFALFMIMENGSIQLPSGEYLVAHPFFKMVFTDNRIGNINFFKYHGTFEQSAAFIDRINNVVKFTEYKDEEYVEMLSQAFPIYGAMYDPDTGVRGGLIKRLIEFHNLVEEEHQKGGTSERMSLRNMKDILRNYSVFGSLKEAISIGYVNRMNQEADVEFLNNLLSRMFV